MKKKLKFDVAALVRDCGGPSVIQGRTGICRTQFYRMARRGNFTIEQLCKIKAAFPIRDLDKYFVEAKDDGKGNKDTPR